MKIKSILFPLIMIIFIISFVSAEGAQEVKEEKVKLTLYCSQSIYRDAILTELTTEYSNLRPNVDIKYTPFGGSLADSEAKIALSLSQKTGPDIFRALNMSSVGWAASGWIDPPPDDLKQFIKENIASPSLLRAVTYKGEMFTPPLDGSWFMLHYNNRMFESAGLRIPSGDDWNWETFISFAKKLTLYDSSGQITRSGWSIRKRGNPEGTGSKWLPFFFQAGGNQPFDAERAYINSDAGYEALNFYEDALYKHKVDDLEIEEDYKALGHEKTAMVIRLLDVMSGLMSKNFPGFEWQVAKLPKGKRSATVLTSATWSVNAFSDYKEEAWDFLRWFYKPDQYYRWVKGIGGFPLFKDALKRPEYAEDESVKIAYSVGNDELFPQPLVRGSYDMMSEIGRAVERVAHKDATVQQALNEAAEKINQLLKQR